jgi:hypothetical protein
MGSATTYGFEVQKVNIGTTNITSPIFFLEYGGKLYANDLLLNHTGGIYVTGNSRRHIIASSDSSGNVYLVSIGASYPPTLQAVSLSITVHISGA